MASASGGCLVLLDAGCNFSPVVAGMSMALTPLLVTGFSDAPLMTAAFSQSLSISTSDFKKLTFFLTVWPLFAVAACAP